MNILFDFRCNVLLTLALLLVSGTNTIYAQTVTAHIRKVIDNRPPFLIVNIPSGDCILCRGPILDFLKSSNVDKDKLFLLSDDEAMSNFYKDHQSLFGQYRKVYDENLSRELSVNGRSSVTLVDTTRLFTSAFDKMDSATFILIHKVLPASKTETEKRSYTFSDGIITLPKNFDVFSCSEEYSLLVNRKFQIATLHNWVTETTKTSKTSHPPSIYNKMINVLQNKVSNSIYHYEKAKFPLQQAALQPFVLENVSLRNQTSFIFRVVAIIEKSANDSSIDLRARSFYFLSKQNIESILSDTTHIAQVSLIDTFQVERKTIKPIVRYGYQLKDDTVFMIYTVVDSMLRETSHRMMFWTALKFMQDEKAKLLFAHAMEIGFEKNDDMKIHFLGQNQPVIVNNSNRMIFFKKESISFDELINSNHLTRINAIDVGKDTLFFVGQLHNKHHVKGYYLLNAKKALSSMLDSSVSDAGLHGRNVSYYSRSSHNEILFKREIIK